MKPLLENWIKQIEEELEDYKSSFEVKGKLTPEVWENNQLKDEVLQVLREIARDFFEGLELGQAEIKDIILTGSLANYNWSEYSDIDLHILVDFAQIDENTGLVKDFFDAKRSIWNGTHDIQVMGYEVEIYVQDINESHMATGQYSIMNDSWIIEPNKVDPVMDWNSVKLKYDSLQDQIDRVAEIYNNGDHQQAHEAAIGLQDKLRKFRKAGLETGGEFSVENLTFKALRRSGAIGELIDIKHKSYDAMMSLDSPLPA